MNMFFLVLLSLFEYVELQNFGWLDVDKGSCNQAARYDENPHPGSRYNSISWSNGDVVHIFGGYGIGGMGSLGYLNDLFLYEKDSWSFTGSTSVNSKSSYSGEVIIPGGRGGACVHHLVSEERVFVSGGFGYAENENVGYLSDVFSFNLSSQTFDIFMSGSMDINEATSFSTTGDDQFLPYPYNKIGSRQNHICFVQESTSKMFIFGGKGIDKSYNFGMLNDLFVTELRKIRNNEEQQQQLQYSFISGSMERNKAGTYNEVDDSNTVHPGSRYMSHVWVDQSQNKAYIFGGFGFGKTISRGSGYLSDFFSFDMNDYTFKFILGDEEVIKVEEEEDATTMNNLDTFPYLAGGGSFKMTMMTMGDDDKMQKMLLLMIYGGMTTKSHYSNDLQVFRQQQQQQQQKDIFQYERYYLSSKMTGLFLPTVIESRSNKNHSIWMLYGGSGICSTTSSDDDDDGQLILGYHSSIYRFTTRKYSVCDGLNSTDPKVCDGKGQCIHDEICVCTEGYSGQFCEIFQNNNNDVDPKIDFGMFTQFGIFDVIVLVFIVLMIMVGVCTSLFCITQGRLFRRSSSEGAGNSDDDDGILRKKSLSMTPRNKGVFLTGGTLDEYLLQSEEDEEDQTETILMMNKDEESIGRIDPRSSKSSSFFKGSRVVVRSTPARPKNKKKGRTVGGRPKKGRASFSLNRSFDDRRRRTTAAPPILTKEIMAFQIDSREFMFGRIVGRGKYSQSTVHNAVLRGESVVVKRFKDYPGDILRSHVQEISLLLHPNIPYFYGFSLHNEIKRKSGSFIGGGGSSTNRSGGHTDFNNDFLFRMNDTLHFSVCLEYCENKDIKTFYHRSSHRFLGLQDQIELLINISRAMMYLHANNVVHGHITSKNVLLDRKFVAKLDVSRIQHKSDKEILMNNYDKREMIYFSPEYISFLENNNSISSSSSSKTSNNNNNNKKKKKRRMKKKDKYSSINNSDYFGFKNGVASDIYAFSIVMYEVLTQDFQLFESFDDDVSNYIDNNNNNNDRGKNNHYHSFYPPSQRDLLQKLRNDPLFRPTMRGSEIMGKKETLLYEIMQKGWEFDIEERITAREIVQRLKEVKKYESQEEEEEEEYDDDDEL